MKRRIDQGQRVICVVTGTRADFGLLRPVMSAIAAHPALQLRVVAAGAHLLPPATIDEVRESFEVAATIPMQSPGHYGRACEAEALGLGITGFAELFAHDKPDVVLVLGDRIEAFAAAAAAAVCGIRVAHMHGGDRAEGIADESLRHALTKFAHLHLPATQQSAMRIIAMGEDHARVHVVGSPAIDGLGDVPPLDDKSFAELGRPEIVVLLHPVGDEEAVEHERAMRLIQLAQSCGRTLALFPNHDPGRQGIARAIRDSECRCCEHLPRNTFIGMLKRARILAGNSSAGLIEAAAIPIRSVNIGARQSGREMPPTVCTIPDWDYETIEAQLAQFMKSPVLDAGQLQHPYGDGQTGLRTAALLAEIDLQNCPVSKRNTY